MAAPTCLPTSLQKKTQQLCLVSEAKTITYLGQLSCRLSEVKVAQLCPTLCDPKDVTVHGILQARILGWVAFPFSRGSSQTRDRTQVSHIAGRFFTSWATREAQAQQLVSWLTGLLCGEQTKLELGNILMWL